jgi:hypothetical protein
MKTFAPQRRTRLLPVIAGAFGIPERDVDKSEF